MNPTQVRLCSFLSVVVATSIAACGATDDSQPEGDGATGGTCVGGSSTGGSAGTGGSSTGGLGVEAGAGGASDDEPGCVDDGENLLCAPAGFPFVSRTFAVTDSCAGIGCEPPNPSLTQPEPGTLCMSGTATVSAGFPLIFFLSTPDFAEIVQAFDADARGITDVSFTLDSPPEGGVIVDAGIVTTDECPDTFACVAFGFTLPRITDAGTFTVPLVEFLQSNPLSQFQSFDTSRLSHIGFTVGDGPYDFCVRDFKFLDAAGDVVNP